MSFYFVFAQTPYLMSGRTILAKKSNVRVNWINSVQETVRLKECKMSGLNCPDRRNAHCGEWLPVFCSRIETLAIGWLPQAPCFFLLWDSLREKKTRESGGSQSDSLA